jgi:hypothetical protein
LVLQALDCKVHKEFKEKQEPQELLEQLVPLEQLGLVFKVLLEQKEILVQLD